MEGLGKKSCKMISAAGPNEFLYLFKNASFVITSSFHGTVYSLLFEKQFISLSSMDDDRIPSLLEFMRLEDRDAILAAWEKGLKRDAFKRQAKKTFKLSNPEYVAVRNPVFYEQFLMGAL